MEHLKGVQQYEAVQLCMKQLFGEGDKKSNAPKDMVDAEIKLNNLFGKQ